MKIIFMGTAEFSAEILDVLISNFDVRLVVSQPDRKIGRKRVLTKTKAKELAEQYDIEVFQPENLRKDYQKILDTECDLIVTASYGQYVPEILLNHPKLGAINVHASLLPKYRGGAPIHRAIKNGDSETGITIQKMAKKIDAGEMISKKVVEITKEDTASTMFEKLAKAGARLVVWTVYQISYGKATYTSQNEEEATMAPNIRRDEEEINWSSKAFEIDCHIRGFDSWPGTYTIINDTKVKIFPGRVTEIPCTSPGKIEKLDKTGMYIGSSDYLYQVTELQVQGKKRMLVKDFLNGNSLINEKDQII